MDISIINYLAWWTAVIVTLAVVRVAFSKEGVTALTDHFGKWPFFIWLTVVGCSLGVMVRLIEIAKVSL